MSRARRRIVRAGTRSWEVELTERGDGLLLLGTGGEPVELHLERSGASHFRFRRADGTTSALVAERDPSTGLVWVAAGGHTWCLDLSAPGGERRRGRAVAAGGLEAPMPGKVVRVEVAAGDVVRSGQTILIVEAMKMEHSIRAPRDGKVVALHVAAGDMVASGQPLAEIDGGDAPA